jgi:hypothetical protein
MAMHGKGVSTRILIQFRRFLLRLEPYSDVIILFAIVSLFVIGLYTGRIPIVTTPPTEPVLPAPTILERIVMLVMILVGLTLIFVTLREGWDFQTKPIGMRIHNNLRLGFVKAMVILSAAMSMSQGLDSLIRSARVASSASALDFGVFAAALLTLYGPTKMLGDRVSPLGELHDIVKHFVLGLLFLAIVVNIFVATPVIYPPLVQMIFIAIVATILDGLLSLIPENWNKIRPTLVKLLRS